MKKRVKSDIPQGAIEKKVREHKKKDMLHGYWVVDCFFKGNLVGQRVYNLAGLLAVETPMKDGFKHGREITWNEDGNVLLIEPYVKGKIHGTAKQYGRNGKVVGTSALIHGTGFDVWRQEDEDDTIFISEIHSLQDGVLNGYEWWFASAQQDLWHERHWYMGRLHGIERVWNNKGKLRRGYPKFYVADRAVSRQKYIKMALQDKTLPAFREKDNTPFRELPSEVK